MVVNRDFEARHGRTMSYEVYKPSPRDNRMPVFFIHSWRSSPAMFHDLVVRLDLGGIRCILPHFTTNHSDPLRRFAYDSLIGLIDELHVDRFGIVAFSMFGGSITRRLIQVLGYQRFTFVSLLSPGPCLVDSPVREAFWNMLPAEIRAKILDVPAYILDEMVEKAVNLFETNDSVYSRDRLYADLHALVEEITNFNHYAKKKHGACPVPIELICGELDEVVPLELSFRTVQDFSEVYVNVIPLAGHHFVTDFYEETARCIQEFLQERVELDRLIGREECTYG